MHAPFCSFHDLQRSETGIQFPLKLKYLKEHFIQSPVDPIYAQLGIILGTLIYYLGFTIQAPFDSINPSKQSTHSPPVILQALHESLMGEHRPLEI